METAQKDEIEGSHTTGILWMVLTGVLFVAVQGIVRHLGSDMPAIQSAFLRYVIGTVFLMPVILPLLRRGFSAKNFSLFAFRGVVHSAAVALWFFAMARIPIAEVTAIGYTAPIFIAIGAAVFFGEKLRFRRVMAVVAGLVGVVIILRPGFQEISVGQFAQLASCPLFAASYLCVKKLSAEISASGIVMMLSVFVTLALAPAAWVVWQPPQLDEVLWLGVVALVATLGHYTMTRAIVAAPMTVIQPVTFLQLVWATALGYVVFGERIDGYVMLGGGIIIAAVTFISYREAVVQRANKTPPAAATKL